MYEFALTMAAAFILPLWFIFEREKACPKDEGTFLTERLGKVDDCELITVERRSRKYSWSGLTVATAQYLYKSPAGRDSHLFYSYPDVEKVTSSALSKMMDDYVAGNGIYDQRAMRLRATVLEDMGLGGTVNSLIRTGEDLAKAKGGAGNGRTDASRAAFYDSYYGRLREEGAQEIADEGSRWSKAVRVVQKEMERKIDAEALRAPSPKAAQQQVAAKREREYQKAKRVRIAESVPGWEPNKGSEGFDEVCRSLLGLDVLVECREPTEEELEDASLYEHLV